MKKVTFLLIAALVCGMSFGQVKVDSQGNLIVGNPNNASGKLCVDGVFRIKNWTDIIADMSGNSASPVMYPSTDWYLQLGKSNKRVGTLYVATIHYNYIWSDSDKRLKENIKQLNGSQIEKIKQISAYAYNFKSEYLPDTLSNEVRAELSKTQIGFLAQELEKEFPELVKRPDSENEYYAVNYVGMIPILLEAIKEQQMAIEKLQKETADLKITLEDCCTKNQAQPKNMQIEENTKSYLEQNVPNPFDIATEIKCFVSEDSENAVIYVFNLQGTLKLQKPIYQKGENSITIFGSELEAGMYVYSLFINGKEVDSKKMLLTK